VARDADAGKFRDAPTLLCYGALAGYAYWLYAYGPALALLRSELHFSYTMLGVYSAIWSAGAALAGVSFAPVARRLPRAPLLWSSARVSDILCARLIPVRYRMFIRCLSFALSDVPVPGLFSGPAESDLPLLVRADAACPGYPGVCCCPGRLLPDPLRIAWRPFPSVTEYSRR